MVGMFQHRFHAAVGVAGFSRLGLGVVKRRGRYGGVAGVPRKEGVVVGCRPSHPLHQTCACRQAVGQSERFAWFSSGSC